MLRVVVVDPTDGFPADGKTLHVDVRFFGVQEQSRTAPSTSARRHAVFSKNWQLRLFLTWEGICSRLSMCFTTRLITKLKFLKNISQKLWEKVATF